MAAGVNGSILSSLGGGRNRTSKPRCMPKLTGLGDGGTLMVRPRFRNSMDVHLTPELEQLVQSKVKSGRYNSVSEVVREALQLMEERDQMLVLRKHEIR